MILLIEDDRSIREDLAEFLGGEGFEVSTATHGQDALELLRGLQTMSQPLPSLILLDLMMPIMDGWGFRENQVQDATFKTIPVVVMTADGHAREKATQMKAEGFLRKPLDIDRLLETISKYVAKKA